MKVFVIQAEGQPPSAAGGVGKLKYVVGI